MSKSSKNAIRYGGILIFSSFALVIQGVTSFMNFNPTKNYTELNSYEAVLIVCSIFLIAMGAIGIGVGFGTMICDSNSPIITAYSLLLVFGLGVTSFSTLVFAQYIYNYENKLNPPNFPVVAYNSDWIMAKVEVAMIFGSIFSSFFISACTQGLQLYYIVLLHQVQVEESVPYGIWCRLILSCFYLAVFLGGVGMVVLGVLINRAFGDGELEVVIIFPPNYVKYADITLLSGIFLLIYSAAILGGILAGRYYSNAIYQGSTWLVLWMWSAFIMTSIAKFKNGQYSGPAASITALMTVAVIAPAIIVSDIDRFEEERDRKRIASHVAHVRRQTAMETTRDV
jgi:hypothetical protein